MCPVSVLRTKKRDGPAAQNRLDHSPGNQAQAAVADTQAGELPL